MENTSGEGTPLPDLPTLSDRIRYLFENYGQDEQQSYRKVAAWIRDNTGERITPAYLYQLATGEQTNPTLNKLVGIATYFGVQPSFLIGETTTAPLGRLPDEPELRVLTVKARALSPAALRVVDGLVDSFLKEEGRGRESQGPSSDR